MNRGWKILMWVVLGIAIFALFTLVTQMLWNWLVPALFSGPAITFWQALGLLVLSKILFSGLGGKGHCHRHHPGSHWKHRLHDKFSSMTSEEKEAFKKKMWQKWCSHPKNDPEQ